MTRTDQAFIEAFRRQSQQAAEQPRAAAPGGQRHNVLHGPHGQFSAKTPLTEAIAQRLSEAATKCPAPNPDAALMVRSFAWPQVVQNLADQYADQYIRVASQAATTAGSVVLGIAGVHSGSGATTTLLAIARCLAAEHGPIAVVDADPQQQGLADALGVLKTKTLADTIAAGDAPIEAVVHAIEDHISLVVTGPIDDAEKLSRAAQAVLAPHPIILIDLGPTIDQPQLWASGSVAAAVAALRPDGVVLVRRESDLSSVVGAAQRIIQATGAPAIGIVENLTATA